MNQAELAHVAAAAGLAAASIVVQALDQDGPRLCLAADRPMPAASMIKVPIAAALVDAWSRDILRPTLAVAVEARNMTANDAGSPLLPGCRASLEELGRLMLARSDNVATNVLIDVLGRDAINSYCRSAGLAGTAVRRKLSGSLPLIHDPEATGRNSHPAADAARLFELIAARGRNDWLYDALAQQEWNDKLSRGLLPGDRFAHKTGDTDEVSHDGGILELRGGARFVVVVYVPLGAGPEVAARHAAFMRGLRPRLER